MDGNINSNSNELLILSKYYATGTWILRGLIYEYFGLEFFDSLFLGNNEGQRRSRKMFLGINSIERNVTRHAIYQLTLRQSQLKKETSQRPFLIKCINLKKGNKNLRELIDLFFKKINLKF